MKVSIRRWLGFAALPAALLMLGLSSPAHADNFVCNNDFSDPLATPVPSTWTKQNPFPGEVIVTNSGTECIIDHDIYATGKVRILSFNKVTAQKVVSLDANVEIDTQSGDIDTKDVEAATFVEVYAGNSVAASDGDIRIDGNVIMNATDTPPGATPLQHGNILLRAYGNISTKDILNGGPNYIGDDIKTGAVQINANMNGGSTPFVIGGGGFNGINGVVNTETKTGGGTDPLKFLGGVRISNPGGILVTSMSAIKVEASESRSGSIQLIVPGGEIILPAGKLSADGQGDNQAGVILLSAKKITTDDGTVISTTQSKNAPGSVHQVAIAAEEIQFTGEIGLKIHSNGNGVGDSQPGIIYILPEDGFNPLSSGAVEALNWTFPFTGTFFQHPGKVYFNGSPSSPLEIMADGQHTQIGITGDDIIFNGGNLQIQAKGGKNNAKHEIVLGYFDFGSYDGTKGLTFNNTGTVEFLARGEGPGASGGDIQIQVDKTTLHTPKLNIKANGPQAQSGDGGTIYYTTSSIEKANPDVEVKFLADASVNSTGNAQLIRFSGFVRKAIYFDAGSTVIPVGKAKGQFNFSATGGGAGGNGGAIEIVTQDTVRVRNQEDVIDASALGDNGNGGNILVLSGKTVFVQTDGDPTKTVKRAIDASGGVLTGSGGTVLTPIAEGKNNSDINVNAAIHVNAGLQEPGSSFHGKISLNSIECLQIRTANQSWPRTIWSCNGATQATKIVEAANMLTSLKPQLLPYFSNTLTPENPQVELYSMKVVDDYLTFFNTKLGTNQSDKLILGIATEAYRNVAAFDNVKTDNGTFSTESQFGPTSIQASTVHELGHQLDYIWAVPFRHMAQDWKDARTNGLAQLDGLGPCTNVFDPVICSDYTNGESNSLILQSEITFNEHESFAHMFEGTQATQLGYSIGQNMESAFVQMTQMKNIMDTLVASPPSPVQ